MGLTIGGVPRKQKEQRGFDGARYACPSCGSTRGLAKFNDSDSGYCHSCETTVTDGIDVTTKVDQEEVRAERLTLKQIWNLPAVDLADRKLTRQTCEYFGFKFTMSPATGEVEYHYYPREDNGKPVGYKRRKVDDKSFTIIGQAKPRRFIGMSQAKNSGSPRLIVTEGELDMATVFQVLTDSRKGGKYAEYKPAVVSASDGAGSLTECINNDIEWVNSFEKVIFATDQDAPGVEARDSAMKLLLPGKAWYIDMSEKDPNAMLVAGKEKELTTALEFKPVQFRPHGEVSEFTLLEEGCRLPEWGLDWPWPTLTRLTYGVHPGHLIGVGAGVGIGKTAFWFELITDLINKGKKPGVFLLEDPPGKTMKRIASRQHGVDLTDPDIARSIGDLTAMINPITKKIKVAENDCVEWEDVDSLIRKWVLVDGCDVIIIDPLTALTAHMSTSDANAFLNDKMSLLSRMARSMDFTCLYSAHLNAPKGDRKPHEEGGRVHEKDITGSRALIRWSHYVIGLERNKQAEDDTTKNTMTVRILKDREFGRCGTFQVFYDTTTTRLTEL